MARVNVYVDGFNLYHGAKQLVNSEGNSSTWKWLDLLALSRRIVPKDNVQLVRYFTANVVSPESDPAMAQRQQAYLRAIAVDPKISIHLGQFAAQRKRMPLVDPPSRIRVKIIQMLGLNLKSHSDGKVTASVWRIEEKGTDVNLGAYLLADAFRGHFDSAWPSETRWCTQEGCDGDAATTSNPVGRVTTTQRRS